MGSRRQNLYNQAHKAHTKEYRDHYEDIFGKKSTPVKNKKEDVNEADQCKKNGSEE